MNDVIGTIKIALPSPETTNPKLTAARTNLGFVQAKLILLRVVPALEQFDKYRTALGEMMKEALAGRPFEDRAATWQSARKEFLDSVSRAFQ